MAEPRWAQALIEEAVGDGNTDGKEDTMNRAAKDLYELYKQRHNDDGTHKLSGFLADEEGTYTGTGIAHAESLTNSSIDIVFLQISRPDTEQVVFTASSMSADETKEMGTNAFQSGMITAIGTTGQFSVGTDAAVNTLDVVYHYHVWGTQ